ncbi:hypothetical protein DPEC_G00237710 [Dallia pectoralis]|uniref:Uncharacterized protein n=1 Tax=Dallia pectoralis TaxID=75939 RepID=A0ACC2FYU8_DALPE|nr:hypothetical protein DPEC_G00237710 [Dallia pectoralis]
MNSDCCYEKANGSSSLQTHDHVTEFHVTLAKHGLVRRLLSSSCWGNCSACALGVFHQENFKKFLLASLRTSERRQSKA